MSNITEHEISKLAAQSRKPPDMTPPEELLWYWLRDIYAGYRNKQIDSDTGAERKTEAIRRYNQLVTERDMAERIVSSHAALWKGIKNAANLYHAERTLENADGFVAAVYGLKVV